MTMTTLAMWMPGGWEWIVILIIGLLLFGRRLPEVGRSVGKTIVEFKKGIKNIEDEIEDESSRSSKELPKSEPAKTVETDERTVSQSDPKPSGA